jgi:hypothetical protein
MMSSGRIAMRDIAAEWLKDPEFRAEYEALEPEFALVSALIEARGRAGTTQAQVARDMGTTQAVIARLEGGRVKPLDPDPRTLCQSHRRPPAHPLPARCHRNPRRRTIFQRKAEQVSNIGYRLLRCYFHFFDPLPTFASSHEQRQQSRDRRGEEDAYKQNVLLRRALCNQHVQNVTCQR